MGCSNAKIQIVQMNMMVRMEVEGSAQNIVEEYILENILLINECQMEHLSHLFRIIHIDTNGHHMAHGSVVIVILYLKQSTI